MLSFLGFKIADSSEGAEEACDDSGMMSHPLDLSYLGVNTIWTNNLGRIIAEDAAGGLD